MLELILLSADERQWCKTKVGDGNQLAFALMLVHFKTFIKFPTANDSPPPLQLLPSVSAELSINSDEISSFDWQGRTAKRFRKEIREHFEFREISENDASDFSEYLIIEILPHNPSKESLKEQVKLYFKHRKLECFKNKQLTRYISSAKHQFEQSLFESIYSKLSSDDKQLIENILLTTPIADKKEEPMRLAELKKDIPGARLKNVNHGINKVRLLQQLPLNVDVFKNLDRKLLLKYYDRVMALSPSNIKESGETAKYAIMAMFCYIRSQVLLDDLVDIFIKLIHRMRTNAENYVDKNILKDVKRINGKFDILEKLARATADNPQGIIEDIVYPDVPRQLLLDLIKDLNQRGKWYQGQVRAKIHSNYAHGNRSILLQLLKLFDFREDHAIYKPILDAVTFINAHWDNAIDGYYLEMPPLDVIPDAWRSIVITEAASSTRVNKYNYEIAILEQLKTFISYKAVWVNGAYRFRDPNEDTPVDFDQNRNYYYDLLGLPLEKKAFTINLKQLLKSSLSGLNSSIISNELVSIKSNVLGKNISISPSQPQLEPENIDLLQKEIAQRWSTINLIDILKECDLLINFTEQMETIAKSSSISTEDLRRRLLLCLYGIGSNTGLKRISIANGDVSFNDLRYTKKRFINKTNVRNAIKMVINSVLESRDPNIWGEATTTVACDSTQISAWDQNLLNEWHHRYKGKGVMIYWHVDKKSLCIYSQLKTCSSSEVSSVIKGVIDHDTQMNMDRVFVDTHGQSVIGFAVSHILGFNLLPRFKAINKQKLYGVTSKDKEKYQNISPIIKGNINWKIIEDNYDNVVKYMAALKLGIVEPSVLIKRFSHDNYNHPVYKALIEIGKAQKTIFLCNYLKSEELRIEINEGLNVVERLNHVMDFIFYGKLGELKTNNTIDQELSVLCLHLLQACMVYINTLIIQQVLSAPHWKNKLTPEDYRALTPLLSAHINPYGLFPIDFEQRITINQTNQAKENHDRDQSNARKRKSTATIETA